MVEVTDGETLDEAWSIRMRLRARISIIHTFSQEALVCLISPKGGTMTDHHAVQLLQWWVAVEPIVDSRNRRAPHEDNDA